MGYATDDEYHVCCMLNFQTKRFIIQGNELINNIVHTYSSRIILIVLGLASNIILTRTLGVEKYGTYAFALTILALGSQFGNCGLHAANLYYVARKKMLLGMLLWNSIAFAGAAGCIISLIVGGIYIVSPSLLKINSILMVTLTLLLPVSLLSIFIKNLLIGIGKIRQDNRLSIASRLVVIVLLTTIAWQSLLTPLSALIIYGIGLFVSLLLSYRILKDEISYTSKLSINLFKKISPFGLKAYISSLLAFLVLKSDLFFVNYYLSKQDLGYYSLAVSFIDYIYLLPVVIGTVLFQQFSSMRDIGEKFRMMEKISFYFIIFYALFLFCMYLSSDYLITSIYGKEFVGSVIPVRILLVAIFFMGIQTVQVQWLNTTGYPVEILYSWGVALLVNVLINRIFIKNYGLYAVSTSTLIAYIIMFLSIRIIINRSRKREDLISF